MRGLPEQARGGAGAEKPLAPVPVVDLPLGATEDRVVGALDLERALAKGEKGFEPGLLARANRGFLYIDEVNLLEDHLVDLLLDVAASGENVVEREGLSVRHPARFVLVGSGNPEEGELRPQLLDRFGLAVDVKSPRDIPTRVEVIRRRDDFDRHPEDFTKRWDGKNQALRRKITAARSRLAATEVGTSGAGARRRIVHGARHGRHSRRADLDPRLARACGHRGRGRRGRRSPAPCRRTFAAPSPAPQPARRHRRDRPRGARHRGSLRGMSAAATDLAASARVPDAGTGRRRLTLSQAVWSDACRCRRTRRH